MTPNYVMYVEGVSGGASNFLKCMVSIYDTANVTFMGRTTFNLNLTNDDSEAGYIADVLVQANSWASTNGWTPIALVDYFGTPMSVVSSMIAAKVPYTAYQGIVSQTGTSAPANTDLMNGFAGTTFTWARTAVGVYTITASSAVFTSGKTSVILGALNNLNANMKIAVTSSTVITITTAVQSVAILGLLGLTATNTDALLTAAPFDIRVYP